MDINSFVPDNLVEERDYQIFLEIIKEVSSDIKGLIEIFPEIVDVNEAPEIFLPKLSELIRYQLRYDVPMDFQREVIKRMIHIYRQRGTEDEIIMAATYGDYNLWAGAHVFYPGADTNFTRAVVEYPIDLLFRHCISKHSRNHRFPDAGMYRAGVILITVPKLNNQIKRAIAKVLPAGLRMYFVVISEGSGDGDYGEIVMGEWKIGTYYELEYYSQFASYRDALVFSGKTKYLRNVYYRPLEVDYYYDGKYKWDGYLDFGWTTHQYKEGIFVGTTAWVYLTNKRKLSGSREVYDTLEQRRYLGASQLPWEDRNIKTNSTLARVLIEDSYIYIRNELGDYVFIRYSEITSPSRSFIRINIGPENSKLVKLSEVPLTTQVASWNSKADLPDHYHYYDPPENYPLPGIFANAYEESVINDLDVEVYSAKVRKINPGVPKRSNDAIFSGKLALDGSFTGEISNYVEIRAIAPTDKWYPVTAIEGLPRFKPWLSESYLKSYQTPADVLVGTEIYVTQPSHGKILINGEIITEGFFKPSDTLNIEVVPDIGYQFDGLIINEETITDNPLIRLMGGVPLYISAEISIQMFDVTIIQPENGHINAVFANHYWNGEYYWDGVIKFSADIESTPDNYRVPYDTQIFLVLTYDGNAYLTEGININGNIYPETYDTRVLEDLVITAIIIPKQLIVEVATNQMAANTSVKLNNDDIMTIAVNYNDIITIDIAVDVTQAISRILLNEEDITSQLTQISSKLLYDGTYEYNGQISYSGELISAHLSTAILANSYIEIIFIDRYIEVNVPQFANGTTLINGSTGLLILEVGETLTITGVPDNDYILDSIIIDEVSVGDNYSWRFTGELPDILVNFVKAPPVVIYSTITIESDSRVNYLINKEGS